MGTMPMACCASGLKAKMKGTGHGTGTRSSSHVFPGAFAACVGSGSLVRTCDIGAEGEARSGKLVAYNVPVCLHTRGSHERSNQFSSVQLLHKQQTT
jgi:hypothetical protein